MSRFALTRNRKTLVITHSPSMSVPGTRLVTVMRLSLLTAYFILTPQSPREGFSAYSTPIPGRRSPWTVTAVKVAPTSSITNPADPGWDCCVANPGAVISFDDGSAMVACRKCSYSVAGRRVHALPRGWEPRTPVESNAGEVNGTFGTLIRPCASALTDSAVEEAFTLNARRTVESMRRDQGKPGLHTLFEESTDADTCARLLAAMTMTDLRYMADMSYVDMYGVGRVGLTRRLLAYRHADQG